MRIRLLPADAAVLEKRADSLAALDPARELQRALERRDWRFIAVCDYACGTPGVPDSLAWALDAARKHPIEGTTDNEVSESQRRLNEVADRYAFQYNTQLLWAMRGRLPE